jgi:hypothetical protein
VVIKSLLVNLDLSDEVAFRVLRRGVKFVVSMCLIAGTFLSSHSIRRSSWYLAGSKVTYIECRRAAIAYRVDI